MYFGEEEEETVKNYVKTLDPNIYRKKVHPLLVKIAKGISVKMKMKPTSLYNSQAIKDECVALMWEKLTTNYDSSRHTKAYSYLSRIAENYYKNVWRTYHKSPITFSRVSDSIWENWLAIHGDTTKTWDGTDRFGIENAIIRLEDEKLINNTIHDLLKIWDEPDAYKIDKNGLKMSKAIKILFEHADDLEPHLCNPKLKTGGVKLVRKEMLELTGLNSKQLTRALDKFKNYYQIMKKMQVEKDNLGSREYNFYVKI